MRERVRIGNLRIEKKIVKEGRQQAPAKCCELPSR